MPYLSLANLPLYVLSPLLLAAIGLMLYRRQLLRRYPAFAAYLAYRLVHAAVFLPLAFQYAVTHDRALYRRYFYAFWYAEILGTLLVFLILYRVFAGTFSRYALLSRWTFVLYMLAMAACLMLAIFVAPVNVRARGVVSIAVPLWQSSMIFSTGMLAFLFVVAFGFGIPLGNYQLGIAAGLGVRAGITLLVAIARIPSVGWLTYSDIIADLIADAIWFVYLFVPHKDPPILGGLTGEDDLARWKAALSEFLHK